MAEITDDDVETALAAYHGREAWARGLVYWAKTSIAEERANMRAVLEAAVRPRLDVLEGEAFLLRRELNTAAAALEQGARDTLDALAWLMSRRGQYRPHVQAVVGKLGLDAAELDQRWRAIWNAEIERERAEALAEQERERAP